jgi:hypothetical protein
VSARHADFQGPVCATLSGNTSCMPRAEPLQTVPAQGEGEGHSGAAQAGGFSHCTQVSISRPVSEPSPNACAAMSAAHRWP